VAAGLAGAWKQYRLDGLPVTLVLDRTGRVAKGIEGDTTEADLRAAIEKALR
jgi:hypothetical protein